MRLSTRNKRARRNQAHQTKMLAIARDNIAMQASRTKHWEDIACSYARKLDIAENKHTDHYRPNIGHAVEYMAARIIEDEMKQISKWMIKNSHLCAEENLRHPRDAKAFFERMSGSQREWDIEVRNMPDVRKFEVTVSLERYQVCFDSLHHRTVADRRLDD